MTIEHLLIVPAVFLNNLLKNNQKSSLGLQGSAVKCRIEKELF